MSGFWSGWVKVLVMLNLGITFLLFVLALRIRVPTQADGTTGHVWAHGVLREGVRNLPLWWIALSAVTFAVGLTYLALYPGFGASKGVLDWTSAQEWRRDVDMNDAKLAATSAPLRSLHIDQIAAHPEGAVLGRRLYLDNCAACHGSEARGNQLVGAPDLTDRDSLYGGDSDTLLASIRHGRNGVMPAWGSALGRGGVNEVAAYVLSLSGATAPKDWVAAGKTRYDTLCAACHGTDGRGNAVVGAPNLTDEVWLYGDDFAAVAATIRDGRSGVMPAWRYRLSDEEIRVIAAWVVARGQRASAAGS